MSNDTEQNKSKPNGIVLGKKKKPEPSNVNSTSQEDNSDVPTEGINASPNTSSNKGVLMLGALVAVGAGIYFSGILSPSMEGKWKGSCVLVDPEDKGEKIKFDNIELDIFSISGAHYSGFGEALLYGYDKINGKLDARIIDPDYVEIDWKLEHSSEVLPMKIRGYFDPEAFNINCEITVSDETIRGEGELYKW